MLLGLLQMGYESQGMKVCKSCFFEKFFMNFNLFVWIFGISTGKTQNNQYMVKKLTVKTNWNLELFKFKIIA